MDIEYCGHLHEVAHMDIIYWSVHSSNRRGGDKVKGVDDKWYRYFASYVFHFVIVQDNLV